MILFFAASRGDRAAIFRRKYGADDPGDGRCAAAPLRLPLRLLADRVPAAPTPQ